MRPALRSDATKLYGLLWGRRRFRIRGRFNYRTGLKREGGYHKRRRQRDQDDPNHDEQAFCDAPASSGAVKENRMRLHCEREGRCRGNCIIAQISRELREI
jgi:hypothetical protein